MKTTGWIKCVFLAIGILTSLGISANDADKSLWLRLDFENQLAPNAGSFKNSVKTEFTRKSEACTPEGIMVGVNIPRFTKGHQGQGLYIGGKVRNLLKPAIADIRFPEGKLNGITGIGEAELKQVKTDNAFTGMTCLKVSTPKILNSGISIPTFVSGNGLYIFSFSLKGDGLFSLSAKFTDEVAANLSDKPISINATSSWRRYFIWFYAKESANVNIEIKSAMGKRMNFFMDALQLEKQQDLNANFERKQFPYGTGFSPGPWIKGRKKSLGDKFKLTWDKIPGKGFPFKEGTITLWLKPEFNPDDCRNHEIYSRYYMTYSLAKRAYSTFGFIRGTNEATNKKQNSSAWLFENCKQTPVFKLKSWCQITVTWSNKQQQIALYLNGILLKEDRSLMLTDSSNSREFLLGSHNKAGFLNGTLDQINIYTKAFSPEEVKVCYEKEK